MKWRVWDEKQQLLRKWHARKRQKKKRQMMLQVVAGEGGGNAVSCQHRQALVIRRARNRSPVPLNNRERHSLNALGGAILSGRPATLSESCDVSMLDRILLRECMCEAILMMMTMHGSLNSVNKSVAGPWHFYRRGSERWEEGRAVSARRWTATHSLEETEGGESEGRGSKDGGMSEEMRTVCLCGSISESDGSLHLSLSSSRTNYKVMDSRLITRAMSGFKLAGSWCRPWCDGEGQERREGGGGMGPEGRWGDVETEELK